jgi:hypothetical protein
LHNRPFGLAGVPWREGASTHSQIVGRVVDSPATTLRSQPWHLKQITAGIEESLIFAHTQKSPALSRALLLAICCLVSETISSLQPSLLLS